MGLKELSIQNFRNYKEAHFAFDSGITIFTGSNGIGKTTILEAVALMGSARTFRNGKNEDFIKRGEELAVLSCKVNHQGLVNDLRLNIQKAGKRIYQNGKMVKKAQHILSILPSVVFSPADHMIIDGDSSDRKQFLNRAAANINLDYLDLLTKFNQVLLQRNKLLKQLSENNTSANNAESQLSVWDEQFLSLGTELIMNRTSYINELAKKVEEEYRRISRKEELFHLRYMPLGLEFNNAADKDFIHKQFTELCRNSIRRDLALSATNIGPHKDEILLTLNGNKVKFYGSQGEKRTCALALRLGEVSLFREKRNRAPILLIDDVSSELDSKRRQSLVELLHQEDTQVLITATELPTTLMQNIERKIVHWDLMKLGENGNDNYGKNFQ